MQSSALELPAALMPTTPALAEPSVRAMPRLAISARFLLGIYAIVPACTLVMLGDLCFLRESLFRALPTSPESFFWFQLLFGTPHIIASSVILFGNRDYVRAYWPRIAGFTLVVLLFFGVGSLFIPYRVFLAVVGAATILHVIKQQVGVGKGLCRLASPLYDAWGWTMIVFGSILYYAIYAGYDLTPDMRDIVDAILVALAVAIFGLTLACRVGIKTPLGRFYLWANAFMVLQSGMFYLHGYSFLAILGPRLVHDLTAFTFYVAHDVNRHGAQPQNLLYRLASKLGMGIFWVGPAFAVLLTFLLARYADDLASLAIAPILGQDLSYSPYFLIVGYLGLLHYYTEVFTWRQGSPYRQHVAMTA